MSILKLWKNLFITLVTLNNHDNNLVQKLLLLIFCLIFLDYWLNIMIVIKFNIFVKYALIGLGVLNVSDLEVSIYN